ncbi:motile sperm domain-containing protein 3 isoform X2 [Hemicordylus capensis]|uniref:motile sperm domain-containing protein 3 isoform X2 n=1 Tax=Hemicordylus capensis TaxID=884348 RepID=UPI002303F338|nr:motile sperm domain-containing protein 3 isoform X2 [Hemicordylus capensis]
MCRVHLACCQLHPRCGSGPGLPADQKRGAGGPPRGGKAPPRAPSRSRSLPPPCTSPGPLAPPRPLLLYLAMAAACLGVLMLPLQGQPSELLPSILHVTPPQKLVAAYILGLLTAAFLQS